VELTQANTFAFAFAFAFACFMRSFRACLLFGECQVGLWFLSAFFDWRLFFVCQIFFFSFDSKRPEDLAADAAMMVEALTTTKRFHQLNARLCEIHQRYGMYTIVLCGHSLAGELSRQLLLKNPNLVSAACVQFWFRIGSCSRCIKMSSKDVIRMQNNETKTTYLSSAR
jgi:pimeloyl-ACP methyl ester carboxylesterase